MKHNDYNNSLNDYTDDDFFNLIFSFALVLRVDIADIQRLKKFLVENNIEVIYQKTSTNRLIIKELPLKTDDIKGMGSDD